MKLPSKRVMTRLAVLSVVVGLGGFAIAQAHFALKKSEDGETPAPVAEKDAAAKTAQNSVGGIPDSQADADPPRGNPFIDQQLRPASHEVDEAAGPRRIPASDAAYRPLPPPARGSEVAPASFPSAIATAAIGDTPSPAAGSEGAEASVVTPPRGAAPGGDFPVGNESTGPTPVATDTPAATETPGGFGGGNVLRSRIPATDPAPYGDTDRFPTTAPGNDSAFPVPVRPSTEATALPGAADSGSFPPTRPPVDASDRASLPPVRTPAMDSRFDGIGAAPGGAAPYGGAVVPARPPANMAALPNATDSRTGAVATRPPAPAGEGTGTPGEATLEGPQTPAISLQKTAPTEIQVGKPARFATKVRNTGQATATNLVIRDEVPRGTKLIDTSPSAARIEGSEIIWELGSLDPNQETLVAMQVMPLSEGEVGSVATVSFDAQASVRAKCTRPELVIEHTAPRRVLAGQPVAFSIKLSNPGSGSATGVTLEETVPAGLSHPAGTELEFEVGTLAPGETRELELTLNAKEAGMVENILIARADANLVAEDRTTLEVIAPALKVTLDGPHRRYLERPAKYEITISNPGTATAKDVELVASLPPGVKFQETNNAGVYDKERHSVFWSVAELPADGGGTVELVVMPLEEGEQKIRVEGRAETGLVDAVEHTVAVEGLASLYFEVRDASDPIEVGEDTIYEIRILNEGSKTSENIRLVASLPNSMKPLSGEGATRGVVQGQLVQFEPLARLAPKADVTYKIRAQGLAAGYQRISVQVQSDEMEQPVTREEITRVYSDQ